MKKQIGSTVVEVVYILLSLAAVVGWIWNIVKIVQMPLEPLTTILIVRIVGIFVAPLGAVIGYL